MENDFKVGKLYWEDTNEVIIKITSIVRVEEIYFSQVVTGDLTFGEVRHLPFKQNSKLAGKIKDLNKLSIEQKRKAIISLWVSVALDMVNAS